MHLLKHITTIGCFTINKGNTLCSYTVKNIANNQRD